MFAVLKITYGKSRLIFNSILFIFQPFSVAERINWKCLFNKGYFCKTVQKTCILLAKFFGEGIAVEYAFYNAVQKTTAKDRTSGVSFKNMSESISVNGQPLERNWAYVENLSVTDEWKIPNNIKKCFHWDSEAIKSNTDAICNNLDNDLPVILVIDISMSFFRLIDDSVLNASANEPKRGTHAILAVGYGETNKDKCILIRNSWGTHWGNSGYGWIHEDYLIPRLHISAVMN